MPKLSLKQADDIIFIHAYRQKLPEHVHPYFDWWVDMVSTKQYKVPEYREGWHAETELEVWLPPELRNLSTLPEYEETLYNQDTN